MAVYPENNAELVNKIGQLLNINLDQIFTLTNTDGRLLRKVILKILTQTW